MANKIEALENAINVAQEGAENVRAQFKDPRDDWAPIVIALDRKGEISIGLLDLSDDEAKELTATKIIPDFIRERKVVALALVVSAWSLEVPKGETLKVPIRRSPQRKEILEIAAMSADSTRTLMSDIQRTEIAPPELSEWEELPSNAKLGGRFVDDIKIALAEVAKEISNDVHKR